MANQDKEQVPWWDGELATWDLYKTKVRIYVDGTEWHNIYLCGPRLVQRLKGPALQAVEGCKPGWLSSTNGAEKLLNILQKKLSRPKVPDMAVYLEDFFFRLRRRKGESAGAWSIRSHECYQRLRRALARVQGVIEPEVTTTRNTGRPWSWATNWATSTWGWTEEPSTSWSGENWGRQTSPSASEPEASVPAPRWLTLGETQATEAWPRTRSGTEDVEPEEGPTNSSDEDPEDTLPEVLPDEVLGWLLLARSGLDAQERAAVLASSGNKLGTRDIEAALRAQWSDADLAARDARKGQQRDRSIFFGEDEATWGDEDDQDEWQEEEANYAGGEEEPWDETTEEEQTALMAA